MEAESNTDLDREKQLWTEAVGRCFHPIAANQGVATFSLQHISDQFFSLTQGFTYVNEDQTVTVDAQELQATDLTTVPQALRWFISRYGRHTPAALLHDALLARTNKGDPDRLKMWEAADRTFRNALEALEVPPIRRHLMWAAVTFGSRWRVGGLPTVGVVTWLLMLVAGTSVLVWAVLSRQWQTVAMALLAPLIGALLWGRQYVPGLIASYGGAFVALPTFVGTVSYALYWALEKVVINSSRHRRQTYEAIPDTGF